MASSQPVVRLEPSLRVDAVLLAKGSPSKPVQGHPGGPTLTGPPWPTLCRPPSPFNRTSMAAVSGFCLLLCSPSHKAFTASPRCTSRTHCGLLPPAAKVTAASQPCPDAPLPSHQRLSPSSSSHSHAGQGQSPGPFPAATSRPRALQGCWIPGTEVLNVFGNAKSRPGGARGLMTATDPPRF